MSGPIVRKYGFPNFDKIFGSREVQHGRDPVPAGSRPSDPPQPIEGEQPGDLVPDLDRGEQPLDAGTASEGNTMSPSTEFGQASG